MEISKKKGVRLNGLLWVSDWGVETVAPRYTYGVDRNEGNNNYSTIAYVNTIDQIMLKNTNYVYCLLFFILFDFLY